MWGLSKAMRRKVRLPAAPGAQLRQDAIGLEALTDQVAVEASEFGIIGDRGAVAQPPFDEGSQQGILVDASQRLVDGTVRRGAGDAGGSQTLTDPAAATVPDEGFGSRDGASRPDVVQAAGLAQPGDGIVDEVVGVTAAGEPLTHLRLGQLAAREHLEPIEIRRVGDHATSVTRPRG